MILLLAPFSDHVVRPVMAGSSGEDAMLLVGLISCLISALLLIALDHLHTASAWVAYVGA